MTYATEFPDFPADAFPVLPDGWHDSSWHNDTCPSARNGQYESPGSCVLWIEEPEPAKREVSTDPRFILIWERLTGDEGDPVDHVQIWAGDDWPRAELTMRALPVALAFSRNLRAELTPDQMAQILARNAGEASPIVCHSHDFCDANMPMHDAFVQVMGHDPLPDDDSGMSDDSVAVWNQAWELAKATGFAVDEAAPAAPPTVRPGDSVLDVWARLIPGTLPADDAALMASMPADSNCGDDCVRWIEAASVLHAGCRNAGAARLADEMAAITHAARIACRVAIAG